MKVLAANRRARYDYEITEHLVAGLVLSGAETKSTKLGHASLKGSYITMRDGEAYLNNAHITPYQPSGMKTPPDPTRSRKLLLHRRQLDQLMGHKSHGLAAVPIALVLDKRFVKLEVGIGRGKKRYDKRAVIKSRETTREIRRQIKNSA